MLLKVFIYCCLLYLVKGNGCNKTLGTLADLQGKFVYCVTKHSVPVTMCVGCYGAYYDMLNFYDEFVQLCNTSYFDMDRINLVPSTQALFTGLWTKAYCDDCMNNGHSSTFTTLNTNLYNCLSTTHQPCDVCKLEYMKLNDYYLSLDRHNDGEVCFDIQDSMNRTRHKWSKECCVHQYNFLYFSIVLSIISSIIFTFYFGTYLITKRQERNHGLLNDVDLLFNVPSYRRQTQNNSLRSTNKVNNTPASFTQVFRKNEVSKANTESESSDDEPLI